MEWLSVACDDEVGTRPMAVTAHGVPLMLWRPEAGAEPVVFADRCPHRLVPLSAATNNDGRLQCAYHGWEFDAAGACVALPSQEGAAPPRASLPAVRTRIHGGQVQVAAGELPEKDPEDLFTNEDPSLARAWHPVAVVGEDLSSVRLLGRRFD
ncbi:Rieske 2Fe-2S domain-containing protein [Actinoplanes sp. NPDC051411]|uniref:Rieske 2Fe-2S domain-containing protein n=1 Tax=Actinoplanes sp. NPDC051411 TaxID=3155522 RepID=UPI00343AA146